MTFSGILTALVTPFQGAHVDEQAFRALVRRQLAAGVAGLVPCGTTGEAATLTPDEHEAVIRWTVEESAGAVPVLAGVGTNCTRTTITNAARAQRAGADGLLVAAPYYNKPTQQGLFLHFQAVAEAQRSMEVCLYDVPGRTSVHISVQTIERLAEIDNITTLKDATGDLAHAAEVHRRTAGQLSMLSGDDFTTLAHTMVGGAGAISVASNLIPARMVRLLAAARAGELERASSENAALQPLFEALFSQTNPLPIKTALALQGLCQEQFRLPLCPMDDEPRRALQQVLEQFPQEP